MGPYLVIGRSDGRRHEAAPVLVHAAGSRAGGTSPLGVFA